jgi:dihydrofolate synthase/folylpolyglutamate synthase
VAVPVRASRAGRPAAEVAAAARSFQMQAEAAGSLPEAMTIALAMQARPRVLICGSLYLAGEALTLSGVAPD